MVRRIPIITIFTLGLLLSAANLHAQETVSINFRVFGAGLDNFEDLFYYNGNAFVSLDFNRTSRSLKTYIYRGTPRITIFAPNPNYERNQLDTPAFLPLASKRIDQSSQNSLLIFVADKKNRLAQKENRKYKLFLLDDSPEAFPRNTILAINATEVDLYGKVASETISLPSNSIRRTDYSEFTSGNKPVPIAFAFQTSTGARLTMSNNVPLSPNRRVVLILMSPRREGSIRIDVRALTDAISPPETENSSYEIQSSIHQHRGHAERAPPFASTTA